MTNKRIFKYQQKERKKSQIPSSPINKMSGEKDSSDITNSLGSDTGFSYIYKILWGTNSHPNDTSNFILGYPYD